MTSFMVSPDSPILAPGQQQQLQIATHVSAAIGLLGAITTLMTFFLSPRYRGGAMARLAAGMAVGDVVSIAAKAIGPFGFMGGPGTWLCQGQAVLQQWGDLTSILWTGTIALNLMLIMWRRKSRAEMAGYEVYYRLFCFGLPIPLAILPLWLGGAFTVGAGSTSSLYGEAELWCWFGHGTGMARYVFFYAELWTVFVLSLVTYVVVGRMVWRQPSMMVVPLAHGTAGSGGSSGLSVPTPGVRRAKLRYARNTSLYLLAFVVTWLPGTLHRALRTTAGPGVNFGLLMAMAVLSPARGMTNCLVYLYLSRTTQEKSRNGSGLHVKGSGWGLFGKGRKGSEAGSYEPPSPILYAPPKGFRNGGSEKRTSSIWSFGMPGSNGGGGASGGQLPRAPSPAHGGPGVWVR